MAREDITFTVNGLTLSGRLYLPEAPANNLALLFLHGWTGNPNDNMAQFLVSNGFPAMTFSLSGHNDSEGRLENQTAEKSLQETLAAYDIFKARLPKHAKIGAIGNSYGGYVAVLLAHERQVTCLSLRVPANYPDELFARPHSGGDDLMGWCRQPLEYPDNRALQELHAFRGPIQIIEAEFYEQVPHQTLQNYVNAVQDTGQLDYHFMQNWPHSLGGDLVRNQQYRDILRQWLDKQV
jgi:esterase/lipase